MALAKALFRPPPRLRTLPDRWAKWLRPLWMICFGLSILIVVVSTIYAIRASYWVQPLIYHYGLDFDVTTEGEMFVGTYAPPGRTPRVPLTAKVVSINGHPVPSGLEVAEFAKLLDHAHGGPVKVVLRQPNGKTIELAGHPG